MTGGRKSKRKAARSAAPVSDSIENSNTNNIAMDSSSTIPKNSILVPPPVTKQDEKMEIVSSRVQQKSTTTSNNKRSTRKMTSKSDVEQAIAVTINSKKKRSARSNKTKPVVESNITVEEQPSLEELSRESTNNKRSIRTRTRNVAFSIPESSNVDTASEIGPSKPTKRSRKENIGDSEIQTKLTEMKNDSTPPSEIIPTTATIQTPRRSARSTTRASTAASSSAAVSTPSKSSSRSCGARSRGSKRQPEEIQEEEIPVEQQEKPIKKNRQSKAPVATPKKKAVNTKSTKISSDSNNSLESQVKVPSGLSKNQQQAAEKQQKVSKRTTRSCRTLTKQSIDEGDMVREAIESQSETKYFSKEASTKTTKTISIRGSRKKKDSVEIVEPSLPLEKLVPSSVVKGELNNSCSLTSSSKRTATNLSKFLEEATTNTTITTTSDPKPPAYRLTRKTAAVVPTSDNADKKCQSEVGFTTTTKRTIAVRNNKNVRFAKKDPELEKIQSKTGGELPKEKQDQMKFVNSSANIELKIDEPEDDKNQETEQRSSSPITITTTAGSEIKEPKVIESEAVTPLLSSNDGVDSNSTQQPKSEEKAKYLVDEMDSNQDIPGKYNDNNQQQQQSGTGKKPLEIEDEPKTDDDQEQIKNKKTVDIVPRPQDDRNKNEIYNSNDSGDQTLKNVDSSRQETLIVACVDSSNKLNPQQSTKLGQQELSQEQQKTSIVDEPKKIVPIETVTNDSNQNQNSASNGSGQPMKTITEDDNISGDDLTNLKRKLSSMITPANQTSDTNELMPDTKRRKVENIGDLFTMGEQISKELGPREIYFRGKKVTRSEPARVRLGSSVKVHQVAMGALHTLALTEEGQILSFGCNDDFVLGRPLTREEYSNGQAGGDDDEDDMDIDDDELEEKLSGKPLPIKEIKTKVIKVTAGDMHSAALCQNGKVYIWGNFKDESDKVGLFADGEKSPNCSDYLPVILPRQVEFDMNVVDIASGSHHLLMLTDQGSVYTFGEGSKGQLGRIVSTELNSIKTNRDLFLKPNPVSILDNNNAAVHIERVFASQWNSYALSTDGVLYGWGLNNYYQLGLKNDFISQANSLNSGSLFTLIPTCIPVQFKVAQVANGQQHSIALDLDGNVYSCGSALYGKLGHGKEFVRQCGEDYSISEFKKIDRKSFNGERVKKVDCGDFCSMAITESGKLFCWGQGSSHIGTEDGVDLFEPRQIDGPYAECTKFLTISSGAQMASMIGVIHEQQQEQ